MTEDTREAQDAEASSRGLAPEDVQHLEMIQGVISRMAGNSFLIKGWAATLVAAVLVVAVERGAPAVALLSAVPAILFWCLDAYYLWQERMFRSLYDGVRHDPARLVASTGPFSMAARTHAAHDVSLRRALVAATVVWFHGSLLLLSAAVFGVLQFDR